MSSLSKTIILSPGELSLAVTEAMGRYASKPASYREDRIARKSSSYAIYLQGVIGEMAFVRVHGGEMSHEILCQGDGGKADVMLPDGRGVEIKTTRYTGRSPSFMIAGERAMERLKAVGHGCLVQILDYDQAKVFPVYSVEEMDTDWEMKDYGYRVNYVFEPEKHPKKILAAPHGVPGDPVTG